MDLLKVTKKYKNRLDELYNSGLNKSSIMGYEKGSVRTAEASVIYSIIRENNYSNAVETGTGKGFSSLYMTQALKDEGLNGIVESIDINKNFQDFLFQKFNLSQFFQFHQGKSDDILPTLNKQYDCALIDSDHSFQQTKNDFLNIFSKIKVGGAIFFHDVYKKPLNDGPRAVLDEIEKNEIGKIIYFGEDIFDFFSREEDVADMLRIAKKWEDHNYSYVVRGTNPKELMAVFFKEKEKEKKEIKIGKEQGREIQEDDYLKEWMDG